MIQQYVPERDWRDETTVVVLAPVQRKLFTPWPALDFTAWIRKLASGPAPNPNRIGDLRLVNGAWVVLA